MSMTVAEARSEIKSLYEKADLIEKKYDGEITNNEDLAAVKTYLTDIDALEAKLSGLEDAEARRNRIMSGLDRFSKPAAKSLQPNPTAGDFADALAISPGDQFVQSREYRDLKMNGHFNSNLARVQFAVNLKDGTSLIQYGRQQNRAQKTLLYGSSASSGGGFVQNDVQPGYVDIRQRELSFLDLLPRVTTESDTIEYVYETTFTNAAAGVDEATVTTGTTGKKPQSAVA